METEAPDRSHLCDTRREEIASLITHAAGALFSLTALIIMLVISFGSVLAMISAAAFGVSLVVLYTSSTLYHISTTHRWKSRFQTL
ncbi:MAG TPA: hemolysin III family protein, partial [Luteolibacter sp.]|nr:hemolysin III family protein [Luteolibacter sp.]